MRLGGPREVVPLSVHKLTGFLGELRMRAKGRAWHGDPNICGERSLDSGVPQFIGANL